MDGSDDGSHLGSFTSKCRIRKIGGITTPTSSFVSLDGGFVGGSVGTQIGIGAFVWVCVRLSVVCLTHISFS